MPFNSLVLSCNYYIISQSYEKGVIKMKKILAIMFLLIPVTCLAEVKSQVKNNYDNVWDKMAKLASANNSCSVDADCKLQKFNSLDVKPKEIKNGQASAILYSTKMPENKLKEFNDLVAKYNNSAKTSLEKAYMPNLTLKCEKNACAFNTDTMPNAVKKTNDKNI